MTTGHLFGAPEAEPEPSDAGAPLAERMRPRTLDDIVGQQELLGRGRPLREAIERDALGSLILWGPPGTGKTTIARLVATVTRAHFIAFSAVLSGIRDIKAVMAEAEATRRASGRRTILFVDEIHRFNKAQQDAFLPRVEAGDIVLIGATTENPSFEVNAALLSRSRVFVLQPLSTDETITIVRRALENTEQGLGAAGLEVADDAVEAIARHANGDARVALNLLELAATLAGGSGPISGRAGGEGRSAAGDRQGNGRGGRAATEMRPPVRAGMRASTASCWRRPSSGARCATTRGARSTSTSSRRSTSRSATATRTPASTGWRGCWRRAKIRCTSRAASSASPPRTSGTPTRPP